MKNQFIIFLSVLALSSISTQAQIIFEDEFKNNKNSWPEGQTVVSDVKIIPGREMYQVKHKSKKSTEAWTVWNNIEINESKDFKISALFYKEGGVTNYGYGILWGGTTDNYYSFLISPGGYYSVGKVVNGDWIDITPDWVESSIVEQGRKGTNKLALSKIGGTYHFEINDREVATMKLGPFFGHNVGFNINNKQKIMVDWIKVEYL